MKTLVTLVLVFVGTCCFAQEPTKEEKKEDPMFVIDGINTYAQIQPTL